MPTAHWGFCLLTFATSTFVGFVGLMAARNRWSPIAKVGYLAGLLGILFSVRAYEPMVFFLLQVAVIFAGVALSRRLESHHEDDNTTAVFSLKHLLTFVAFAAVLLGIGVRCSVPTVTIWINLIGGAVGCGLATLLGGQTAWAEPFRWRHVLFCLLAFAMASIPMAVTDCYLAMYPNGWQWSETFAGQLGKPFPYADNFAHWFAMLTAVFLTVHVLTWLAKRTKAPQPRLRFGSRVMCSTLMFLLISFVLVVFVRMPPYPSAVIKPTATPNQDSAEKNGYRKFASVAQQYSANANDTTSPDHAKTNQIAIRGIEQAVAMGWSIPLPSRQDSISEHWKTTRPIYNIIDQQISSAVDRGDISEVLRCSELTISLGNKYTRQSRSLMGRYLGSNYGMLAMRHLSNVREQMDVAQITSALQLLMSMENVQPSFDDLMHDDRAIAIQLAGWRAMLYPAIASAKEQVSSNTARQEWRKKHAVRRLLMTDLLIRKHLQQTGKLPISLKDVIDKHYDESAVTTDPCSDAHSLFKYVRGEDSFLLYSVSVDGKDDQGKPPSSITPAIGDLLLDAEFETSP